jgi:hypothetical protein
LIRNSQWSLSHGDERRANHIREPALLRFFFSLPNDLPFLNPRREVKSDNVNLQFDSIVVLYHGASDGTLDFAVVQLDAGRRP